MTETKKVPSTATKPQRNTNSAPKGKRSFKKNGKKPLPPRKLGEPVFSYTSECCGAPSEKPPCERTQEDRAENKFSESHLGTWWCSACRRKCKVGRKKNTPTVTAVLEAAL